MSKKNLIEKDREKLTVQKNARSILFSRKKYFYPDKTNKTIEIVIVPKLAEITAKSTKCWHCIRRKINFKDFI